MQSKQQVRRSICTQVLCEASEAKGAGMEVAKWGHEERREQVWISTADGWERHRALTPELRAQPCLGVRTQADTHGCTLWPVRLQF